MGLLQARVCKSGAVWMTRHFGNLLSSDSVCMTKALSVTLHSF
jgi:hypothetical protein